jgi:hypothetical protein
MAVGPDGDEEQGKSREESSLLVVFLHLLPSITAAPTFKNNQFINSAEISKFSSTRILFEKITKAVRINFFFLCFSDQKEKKKSHHVTRQLSTGEEKK